MYTPFDFEGQRVPHGEALSATLLDGPERRAWLIRAAVESPALAEAVEIAAEGLIAEGQGEALAVGLHVARALMARRPLRALTRRMAEAPSELVSVPDPLDALSTLAQTAYDYALQVRPRGDEAVQAMLRAGMAWPELRMSLWRVIATEDPEGLLPHLADLVAQSPSLAGDIATQYALVHTDLCPAAAAAVATLPEDLRGDFAETLHKHLDRIHAVRLWVRCRQILAGK